MAAAKIRKGDRVVILSGKDKGKTGEVTKSMPKDGIDRARGQHGVGVPQPTHRDAGRLHARHRRRVNPVPDTRATVRAGC